MVIYTQLYQLGWKTRFHILPKINFDVIFDLDEAPDTADDSDEDLITSYIPGVGMNNKSGHPIIRIGSPTTGNSVLSDDRPILGM